MGHKKLLQFYFDKGSKRGQNSEISHIWKVYRIVIIHPILMYFSWNDSFENFQYYLWMDFLYLLRFCRYTQPKGANKSRIKILDFFLNFSFNFNAVFANDHLYGLFMDYKIFCYLYFKKGPHIPKICIFGRYI